MKKPAVFLDRDGTLIEEVNFLHRVEDLKYFPFTDKAVALLKASGFLVVLVTNQSGIGRGIYSADDFHAVNEQIQNDLSEKLDAVYFCPHLPDAGCRCRKPNLGMIEAASADFTIDFERSWMVGDKKLDIEFGRAAGLRSILVLTGYGAKDREKLDPPPEIVAADLLEAAKIIIEN
jgi:D-glycero-D-manno-heptose 1,7-bisphosphate phosphatase